MKSKLFGNFSRIPDLPKLNLIHDYLFFEVSRSNKLTYTEREKEIKNTHTFTFIIVERLILPILLY